MKIKLVVIAKTDQSYLKEGFAIYQTRLKHYIPFDYVEIPTIKNAQNITTDVLKVKEGQELLRLISTGSVLVLLDEKGKANTSVEFSNFIQKQMNAAVKELVFVVGGAFGFSEEVYARANYKLSLSAMTFSHQMVRLFFVEQLYRAFTILKGEQYHHQ